MSAARASEAQKGLECSIRLAGPLRLIVAGDLGHYGCFEAYLSHWPVTALPDHPLPVKPSRYLKPSMSPFLAIALLARSAPPGNFQPVRLRLSLPSPKHA